MKISIRKMRSSDLSSVIKLGLGTGELMSGDIADFYSEETLLQYIKQRWSLLLVAIIDGQFAGFRIAHFDRPSREAYLDVMAVKPEYRRLGIGGKLLDATLSKLKDWGAKSAWCLTQTTNESALAFYRKRHFLKRSRSFHILVRDL